MSEFKHPLAGADGQAVGGAEAQDGGDHLRHIPNHASLACVTYTPYARVRQKYMHEHNAVRIRARLLTNGRDNT